jgi:hypothetical protein
MRLPADSVLVLPEYAELLLPDLRRRGNGIVAEARLGSRRSSRS